MPPDRLDSWKEIAGYLKRDVTTVQRWEKREGMPVRRHLHDKLGSVYAFQSELDDWVHRRNAPVGRDRSRRGPLGVAKFQKLTDFGCATPAVAVSRDGRFVAFLSNREGPFDVWVTQIGAGMFYNLTRGRVAELVNPSLRLLDFSPDGTLVTFWARGVDGFERRDITVWAVPTLGGAPRPYLEGAAEFDWSSDGSRLVYHTTDAGDPMFVIEPGLQAGVRPIFAASEGLHAHFPRWSPDGAFVYFVHGVPPDSMDIWRIRPAGGAPERLTHHDARVSDPVFVNQRTLMYLATDRDGSGPCLHSLDVGTGAPHRVDSGFDRYTSLAGSADGRRLVAALADSRGTLWRFPIVDTPFDASGAQPISLPTGRGFSPRLGPGYLLYVSSKGANDGIWKLAGGAATELWTAPDARIIGGPGITPDGGRVAFAATQEGRPRLYVMNADGTNARVVTAALDLRGSPAWAPDGRSIAVAATVEGAPRLFRVSLDGAAVPLVQDYSSDPAWTGDGACLVYSGADVGTAFPIKAVSAGGVPCAFPTLTLTRGARRLRFCRDRPALVLMRGTLDHKDLWLVDLDSGAEQQLTRLPPGFGIRDFDLAPDGREIVIERVQDYSEVVLIDRGRA